MIDTSFCHSVTLSEMYYIANRLSHFGKHSFNNINSYVVRALDIENIWDAKSFLDLLSSVFKVG